MTRGHILQPWRFVRFLVPYGIGFAHMLLCVVTVEAGGLTGFAPGRRGPALPSSYILLVSGKIKPQYQEVIMKDLLPVFAILAFFIFSFWGKRWAQTVFGLVLSAGIMAFFLIMAFVDRARMFPHLFFAILAAGLAWRSARSSGLLSKVGSGGSLRP